MNGLFADGLIIFGGKIARKIRFVTYFLLLEDSSEVTVEFSDTATSTKQRNFALVVTDTNKTIDFQELIVKLQAENIFLRHAQISDFIQQSKSDKRKAVASIIGYDDISDFRNRNSRPLNHLRKDANTLPRSSVRRNRKESCCSLQGKF